jgi:hypothetical protein
VRGFEQAFQFIGRYERDVGGIPSANNHGFAG